MTHPITPPPELVQQWQKRFEQGADIFQLFTNIFQAGADQELEACCEYISRWFATPEYRAAELRAARRPKPPSLKEQALEALDEEHADMRIQNYKLIRSVLESLPS